MSSQPHQLKHHDHFCLVSYFLTFNVTSLFLTFFSWLFLPICFSFTIIHPEVSFSPFLVFSLSLDPSIFQQFLACLFSLTRLKKKKLSPLYCMACGILFPWPGIKPMPLVLEAQSLNPWTTREVLFLLIPLSFTCLFARLLFTDGGQAWLASGE